MPRNNLKRLLNIDALLRACLKIWHCAPALTIRMCSLLADHPPLLTHIDLVAQHDEWKALRISWGGLDQKLVAPRVERVERFRGVDVIYQYAAVGTTIEGDAEGLEAFLSRCVPELEGHNAVVDCDFLGEEVSADGGFVRSGELLVDILIHQTRLADPTVTKDNDL